ncbi:hypothetical protein BDQ17DRAFT_1275914 [Cyathus striatus]|nr:hypothetical protein BDQ17DRAFT_1275914 [Cyathus striatus]
MGMHLKAEDAVKCAETLWKLVDFRRKHGDRLQLVDTLSHLLHDSPFYSLLSSLPEPDATNSAATTTFEIQVAIHNTLSTLNEIVDILEKVEDEHLCEEVEKRRTRLGAAGPEAIRKEVGCEIWSKSRLPALYSEILNHPNTSDELRRETDSKLFRFKQRYLQALPNTTESAQTKASLLREVDDMASGAVLLNIPDIDLWTHFLESQDHENIADYGYNNLRQFIELFPESSISLLLKGYLNYIGVPLLECEDGQEKQENNPREEHVEDPLDVVLNAYSTASETIIGNRILAEIHLEEYDYENAIKVARHGLSILNKVEADTGRKLSQTRTGIQVVLATSYVHLYPPKHHLRALPIIKDILARSPENVPALMGHAYILEETMRWEDAGSLFEKVSNLIGTEEDEGLRAREESGWCQCKMGNTDMGIQQLKGVLEVLNDLNGRESDRARCLWRLGKCCWEIGETRREEAYKYFINSLKHDSSFAPAFTSLGVYYSEYASPLDPVRASKCFQKAFELDPRETEAAERLVQSFSEDREWDLVEVVARRTIEGEGGLDSGIKDDSTAPMRYLPANSWAWKALGVVEINRKNYSAAIQACQIALRAEPDDGLLWLRLGEAYSRAGRHAAAIKALTRAEELEPQNWMPLYFIADVKSQLGLFQDAVNIYNSVLMDHPGEISVLASLSQSYADLGSKELREGFLLRAQFSFQQAIKTGLAMVEQSPGFRGLAWKIIGDSAFFLSLQTKFVDEIAIRTLMKTILSFPSVDAINRIADVLPMESISDGTVMDGTTALKVAAFAYSYRISLTSSTQQNNGSSWFDLGVSLQCLLARGSITEDSRSKFEEKVVHCLMEAIREDSMNDSYWMSLGNAQFVPHPKAAQHAYIKALEIDSKNASIWVNLGLLYLFHNDLELASEALERAQIIDPDFTLAWVGQSLIASATGNNKEATALLEHATGLTTSVPESDYEFAVNVFNTFATQIKVHKSVDALLPAFFVLDRYCLLRPNDAGGLHLFALICEEIGKLELAEACVQEAIAILEGVYEDTEDPTVEKHYTIANSTLGRIRLSLGDFAGTLACFESVIGLLGENDSGMIRTLRVQAHSNSGIAHFLDGNLEAALEEFQRATAAANDDLLLRGQTSILLAQTMWAIGTAEFKESAKNLLLECITTDPGNVTAINTLAGMGMLTDDESLVDAALSEILALTWEERRKADPKREVDYLLVQYYLEQNNPQKALLVAQKSVHAEPSETVPRKRLGTLALQLGYPNSTLAVLADVLDVDADEGSETEVLRSVAGTMLDERSTKQGLREAQRAVHLAPWKKENWRALIYARLREV